MSQAGLETSPSCPGGRGQAPLLCVPVLTTCTFLACFSPCWPETEATCCFSLSSSSPALRGQSLGCVCHFSSSSGAHVSSDVALTPELVGRKLQNSQVVRLVTFVPDLSAGSVVWCSALLLSGAGLPLWLWRWAGGSFLEAQQLGRVSFLELLQPSWAWGSWALHAGLFLSTWHAVQSAV